MNGNWSYGYDQFNRLLSSNKNSGQQTFTYDYDRYGNRWHQNAPQGGPAPQYSFDSNNHITIAGFTYDALGNVTNDAYHQYAYDAENRLIKVDGSTLYVYDAFGRRVKTPEAEYLYDLSGHAVTMLNPTSGSWIYSEIYAGDMHLATYSGGATNFLHSDWLGTKRATTGMNVTCPLIPHIPEYES